MVSAAGWEGAAGRPEEVGAFLALLRTVSVSERSAPDGGIPERQFGKPPQRSFPKQRLSAHGDGSCAEWWDCKYQTVIV